MNIQKMQTWALRAGFAWLAISVVMTGAAGWSFGEGNTAKQILFMLGFPLITIGAATLLPFLELALEKRAFAIALLVLGAWGFCTAGEGFGHLMIIASQRDGSIQKAGLKDAAWEAQANEVRETEAKIVALKGNQDALRSKSPFVTTVAAAGLDAAIKTADDAVNLEASRGGCKDKCQAKKIERDALIAQKEDIAKFNRTADQIAATEAALSKAREKLASMDKGQSDARSQQNAVAQFINASLTPSDHEKNRSGLILELFFVACFLFGPMTLIAVGVRDWNKPKRAKSWPGIKAMFARIGAWFRDEPYTEPLPFKDGKLELVQRIEDQRGVDDLKATLARIIQQNHGLVAHG